MALAGRSHKTDVLRFWVNTHPLFPALQGGEIEKSVCFARKTREAHAENSFSTPRGGFAAGRGRGARPWRDDFYNAIALMGFDFQPIGYAIKPGASLV